MPANIPWGYDQNRVTAMVVDPERLYVYWEVTDDGVAAARKSLGRGRRNGLAQPAGLRHHGATVRRHQRAQLLRPSDRAARPPVVLRDQQADLQRLRRGWPEVGRRVLRQGRALGARGLSAARAGARQRGRMADRARGQCRVRGLATRTSPRGRTAGGGGGGATDGGGGGGERPPAARAVRRLDRLEPLARRLPGSRRAPRLQPALGLARGDRHRLDGRADPQRMDGPAAAHASGKPARSRTRSRFRPASRSTTAARCPFAPSTGGCTSSTGRGRSSSAASARARSGGCSAPGSSAARSPSAAAPSGYGLATGSTQRHRTRPAARSGWRWGPANAPGWAPAS